MYAKIQITGKIQVKTGLHIGGASSFSAIGAVDSPVVRNAETGDPMIPGTSLKGKLRTLLAKELNPTAAATPDDDCPVIARLFGCAKKDHVKRGRLIFSDMPLENAQELRGGIQQNVTEIKFENTINRLTCVANPRQIERVVPGAVFALDLIYDIEDADEAEEDLSVLAHGLKLLQYDYLGGSGTRGYGKIAFKDLSVRLVACKESDREAANFVCEVINETSLKDFMADAE